MSRSPKHLWWLGAALLLLALLGAFRKAKEPGQKEEKVPVAIATRTTREHREKPRERASPVSRYSTECTRGLSVKEVQEIVSNFEDEVLVAGSTSSDEECIDQRRRFHEWYLRALVEGLDLSDEQEVAVRARLGALFDEALAQHREGGLGRRFISAQSWLKEDAYAPWELCELTGDQRGITWHGWLQIERKSNQETGDDPSPWFNLWIRSAKAPGSSGSSAFPEGTGPKEFGDAGAIFPLNPRQNFLVDPNNPTLSELRGLHPAQLRTLLLLFPESLGKAKEALKNP